MSKTLSKATGMLVALALALGLLCAAQAVTTEEAYAAADTTPMYRLYNKWSTEHLFTSGKAEYDNLVKKGWTGEGVAWLAPTSGDPVYRLYNKWSGDHHYTTSKKEYDKCVRDGWKGEGTAFYSGGNRPIYRLFNPYVKSFFHHYTAGAAEQKNCIKAGWKDEKVGWYGYASDISVSSNNAAVKEFANLWNNALHLVNNAGASADDFLNSKSSIDGISEYTMFLQYVVDHAQCVNDAAKLEQSNASLHDLFGPSFAIAFDKWSEAFSDLSFEVRINNSISDSWRARKTIVSKYQVLEQAFINLYDVVRATI